MRTQVGIIGAGPAGLVLSHLLALRGIASVVLENRSKDYVERRVRAGVLEQGSVNLLRSMGTADRLERESMVHHGIELRFDGTGHRIPLTELTGGASIFVYGQQEVVKDLIKARLDHGELSSSRLKRWGSTGPSPSRRWCATPTVAGNVNSSASSWPAAMASME